MKFSLVMATLGRSLEIDRLFKSLVAQEHSDFEVIVVDQNPDDRVVKVIDRFKDQLNIIYLRSEKGLSRARNVGLAAVTGEVICFPDDDSWYPSTLLQYVADQLRAEPKLAGVTGKCVDADSRPSQGRWALRPMDVTRYNIFTCASSATIFLRTEAARSAGMFDEQLGLGSGSRWGAGEEVNFLLKVLDDGHLIRYDPALQVFHPEPLLVYDEKAFARGRMYNRGFGRVLSLNAYPIHFVMYAAARPAVGCVMSICKGDMARARYYWIAASQRVLGWTDRA